ncbi:hypothetical protein C8R46DRAFT_1046998 [Mycena filopes]|nr:hypothetical protein C8R46DRAFT_1046998 [Mycena filopes]
MYTCLPDCVEEDFLSVLLNFNLRSFAELDGQRRLWVVQKFNSNLDRSTEASTLGIPNVNRARASSPESTPRLKLEGHQSTKLRSFDPSRNYRHLLLELLPELNPSTTSRLDPGLRTDSLNAARLDLCLSECSQSIFCALGFKSRRFHVVLRITRRPSELAASPNVSIIIKVSRFGFLCTVWNRQTQLVIDLVLDAVSLLFNCNLLHRPDKQFHSYCGFQPTTRTRLHGLVKYACFELAPRRVAPNSSQTRPSSSVFFLKSPPAVQQSNSYYEYKRGLKYTIL